MDSGFAKTKKLFHCSEFLLKQGLYIWQTDYRSELHISQSEASSPPFGIFVNVLHKSSKTMN